MSKKFIITISIIFKLLSFSFEICHQYCEYCNGEYYNDTNMQCTSCITGRYLIFNTTNCVLATDYPNYYINRWNEVLYPCSSFIGENCYECNPYLNTKGKCISCIRGFVFNNETNEYQRCNNNEIPIVTALATKQYIIVLTLVTFFKQTK